MNQTSTTTNVEIIPQRIAADHYQTQSFTDPNKTYDQKFDYDLKRWICNCEDTTYRKNMNCKHVILLRTYIKKEKAQQAPEQKQHSSSVELMSVLSRISTLEQEQDVTNGAIENLDHALCIKSDQVATLQGKLAGYEHQITQQAKQIEKLMDIVGTLQQDICRLNERTNNQQRTIDDQAQQIDHLHDQLESQARPVEQVVKIVVDQAQPVKAQQTREARQPANEKVTRVSKTECKVGKFHVPVVGNSAAGCNCSIGIMDRQCPHMVKVDQFLSK